MGTTVAIAGASGYAGGELLRLLAGHPDVVLGPLAAAANAGERVTDVHPHLAGLARRTFVATDPELLAESDAVLLALPHGTSAAIVARLPSDIPIVDLGADFRLGDEAAWTRYYGGTYAGAWPYGLPELPGQRSALSGSRRIAVPGCHATAVALALAPLLAAHLVEPTDLAAVSVTGTSGAGRSANIEMTSAQVMGDVSAYKVGRHQHVAEIVQSLGGAAGTAVDLSFTPVLAPMPRGILVTATGRTAATESALRGALDEAYGTEPFVHLLPEGRWPHTGATAGSNSAHVQVTVDRCSGRATVICALDNLVKGAAGQAIQCLNLALGYDEAAGLPINGIAP